MRNGGGSNSDDNHNLAFDALADPFAAPRRRATTALGAARRPPAANFGSQALGSTSRPAGAAGGAATASSSSNLASTSAAATANNHTPSTSSGPAARHDPFRMLGPAPPAEPLFRPPSSPTGVAASAGAASGPMRDQRIADHAERRAQRDNEAQPSNGSVTAPSPSPARSSSSEGFEIVGGSGVGASRPSRAGPSNHANGGGAAAAAAGRSREGDEELRILAADDLLADRRRRLEDFGGAARLERAQARAARLQALDRRAAGRGAAIDVDHQGQRDRLQSEQSRAERDQARQLAIERHARRREAERAEERVAGLHQALQEGADRQRADEARVNREQAALQNARNQVLPRPPNMDAQQRAWADAQLAEDRRIARQLGHPGAAARARQMANEANADGQQQQGAGAAATVFGAARPWAAPGGRLFGVQDLARNLVGNLFDMMGPFMGDGGGYMPFYGAPGGRQPMSIEEAWAGVQLHSNAKPAKNFTFDFERTIEPVREYIDVDQSDGKIVAPSHLQTKPSVIVQDDKQPTLICCGCSSPLRLSQGQLSTDDRLFALACGHLIDQRCLNELKKPQHDAINGMHTTLTDVQGDPEPEPEPEKSSYFDPIVFSTSPDGPRRSNRLHATRSGGSIDHTPPQVIPAKRSAPSVAPIRKKTVPHAYRQYEWKCPAGHCEHRFTSWEIGGQWVLENPTMRKGPRAPPKPAPQVIPIFV